MGAATALVLCAGLAIVPAFVMQVMKVVINGVGQKWTATYRSVQSVTGFQFLMTFILYIAMGNIQLINLGIIDIRPLIRQLQWLIPSWPAYR